MANTNVSHGEVKSICDKLECSPSQHDATGNAGGKPSLTPKNSEAASSGQGMSATKEFQMTDRGKKISGYSGGFAKKAEQA